MIPFLACLAFALTGAAGATTVYTRVRLRDWQRFDRDYVALRAQVVKLESIIAVLEEGGSR